MFFLLNVPTYKHNKKIFTKIFLIENKGLLNCTRRMHLYFHSLMAQNATLNYLYTYTATHLHFYWLLYLYISISTSIILSHVPLQHLL